jgi:hypothetical protein
MLERQRYITVSIVVLPSIQALYGLCLSILLCQLKVLQIISVGDEIDISGFKIRILAGLWASARSPCGGGAGLGRDRPRADSDVRWRTLGRARAPGVMMAARGRGRVESRARGLWYAGVGGFDSETV